MAVLNVEGSRFTKQLTGKDQVEYLVSHFKMNREDAQKQAKENELQGQEFFIRAHPDEHDPWLDYGGEG